MRVRQDTVKLRHLCILETELFLLTVQGSLILETHYDLLTEYGRENVNADIVLDTVYPCGDTTVLRFTLLGNIHSADDLDTGYDSRKQFNVIFHSLVKRTIDTVPDTDVFFHGLDMNIGCSLAGCLLDHGTNEYDDRGVIEVRRIFGRFLEFFIETTFLCVLLRNVHGLGTTEVTVQSRHDIRARTDNRLDLHVRYDTDVVCRHDIHGVGHGQSQDVRVTLGYCERDNMILTEHLGFNQV